MCTLIMIFQPGAAFPVTVAANRDEVRSRPATGPRMWPQGFIAPRDEQAHGTWLGVTKTGLFVGVTNRFPSNKWPERESRGTLVLEALQAPTARVLHERLAKLSATRFNSFHLLYADAQDAFVTWSDGELLTQSTLAPGRHVVTERSLGGDDAARTALIHQKFPAVVTPEALMELLKTPPPGDDRVGGVLVDVPEFNYGTRSSTVLLVGAELRASRLFYADGRPDQVPFIDRADLLQSLYDKSVL